MSIQCVVLTPLPLLLFFPHTNEGYQCMHVSTIKVLTIWYLLNGNNKIRYFLSFLNENEMIIILSVEWSVCDVPLSMCSRKGGGKKAGGLNRAHYIHLCSLPGILCVVCKIIYFLFCISFLKSESTIVLKKS